ncbi:MAG TPA: signal recognition particle-docking protein FtsY [Candidatus Krumholzibacteriaceae bacterium]|nr:signal recognition particle-docking protein FtsY [Candidatus Krumholzibacteriaceae bacterium]
MAKGIFKGLRKTKKKFIHPLLDLFRSGELDDSSIEEIESLLFSADLGIEATERIVERLSGKKSRGEDDEVLDILRSELLDIIESVPGYKKSEGNPRVIIVAGVNGVGKTSTIGKLARRFQNEGKSVLLAACDTFRAAAIEQLELWAQKCDVPVVRQQMGSDPAAVAFDAVSSARSKGIDIVIIDTAGRLHTKKNLMRELEKIFRVLSSRFDDIGLEGWLIIDANSGQNSIRQAEVFVESLPITGMIVTKLDSTSKGGVIIPIQNKLNLPVLYIGVGEGIDDLEDFDHRLFVSTLLSG